MLRYRFPVFGPFPYYLLFSAFNHTRHGIILTGRTYRKLRVHEWTGLVAVTYFSVVPCLWSSFYSIPILPPAALP